MKNSEQKMVLRTVYLPIQMDDQLRNVAFDLRKSKSELIRECVRAALGRHAAELFNDAKASVLEDTPNQHVAASSS